MLENQFVRYLNTLHNYNAQNANVFGEKNIESQFYEKVLVDIPICDYIVNRLNDEPNIIVLTGHAGDGKTSLMYQVLYKLNSKFDPKNKAFSVDLPNGKKCLCIKDYSEFSDTDKITVMKKMVDEQHQGNYVFLVANTGPLINNFPVAFDGIDEDLVKTRLIDLLDQNTGDIEDLFGLKVSLINIVAINNAFFSNEFIDKIIADDLWDSCSECPKKDYCPIFKNVHLIKFNRRKVKEFVYNHYIWVSEYGERLTIRSMTQQLSYMITGGMNCADVKQYPPYFLISSNLFFGYRGPTLDKKALEINAVNEAYKCKYDQKRWRVDEDLFISKNYKSIFNDELCGIVNDSENGYGNGSGWQSMVKRMYLFYNTQIDDTKVNNDLEDIFSSQFGRYLSLKYNDGLIQHSDNALIRDALTMLNVGIIDSAHHDIPITLNRESGYVQNVQLIVGTIKKNKVKLDKTPSNHSAYLGEYKYNDLVITVKGEKLKKTIDLLLLDYFSELRNGIINTNIDAQLSKGLESIKSEILSIAQKDADEETLHLITTGDNGIEEISLLISENQIVEG